MGQAARILEINGWKLGVIELRSYRRRQTFGRSRHKWRRNERDAYNGRRPLSNPKGVDEQFRYLRIVQRSYEDLPNPKHLGTNITLSELGMTNEGITEAVRFYGKDTVKDAGRIGGEYLQRGVADIDPRYLIEVVSLFGKEIVRDLCFKHGIRPEQLLTDFDIHSTDGLRVLTPKKANVPLEVIASSFNIPETLNRRWLSVTYQGQGLMLFDYTHK